MAQVKCVELIIFDLDGTLVNSLRDIANSVNFTLKSLNLKAKSIEEISSYIGRSVEDLLRKSLGGKNIFLKKALLTFEKYYRKHSTDNTTLYPNVKEILEHFKTQKKVIITNRNYESTLLTLRALEVDKYFEDVVGGDDINCAKPSPCPLDRIIHSHNIDKGKTIIIGDMDIDILAGRRAGIITCAVTYGIGRKEDIIKASPDFIIDDIIQLKNIIC
jgi:HAD superfamily hydrolase (TIGR01549 family)